MTPIEYIAGALIVIALAVSIAALIIVIKDSQK